MDRLQNNVWYLSIEIRGEIRIFDWATRISQPNILVPLVLRL